MLKSHTIDELITLAIETETQAMELYESMSRLFAHERGVAEFWDDLRNDETRHVGILRGLLETLPAGTLAGQADEASWQVLIDARERIRRKLATPFATLDEAYEFSHEIEYHEINGVFKFLAAGITPGYMSKEIIDANIRDHQQKLIEFSARFGGKSWRQSVLPQARQ
ncbi:MAG TPA: hypothetical protein PLP29_02300 [Candidatus Ozemobacteraceae bacterium]|nr:hypothetical protein [Candidatus Ozemobacteraceae bacterium]